jgi:hypothetical protein
MSKSIKVILTSVIVLIIGSGLVYSGIWIGRFGLNPFARTWNKQGWGMMHGFGGVSCGGLTYFRGSEMMDGIVDHDQDIQSLSVHQVREILDQYLEGADDPDLILSEVMIFDNHAYAQILEKSSGIGAMEVLVDYQTEQVYPEYGPNMMWNLKYSRMAAAGNFRGPGMKMGNGRWYKYSSADFEDFTEMPISSDQAVAAAQKYLDQYRPGLQADDHLVMFYGYYTLHVLDGEDIIGMLSVNGTSGQVFYHNWHGELIEIDEH